MDSKPRRRFVAKGFFVPFSPRFFSPYVQLVTDSGWEISSVVDVPDC